jgi:hypothetical protein
MKRLVLLSLVVLACVPRYTNKNTWQEYSYQQCHKKEKKRLALEEKILYYVYPELKKDAATVDLIYQESDRQHRMLVQKAKKWYETVGVYDPQVTWSETLKRYKYGDHYKTLLDCAGLVLDVEETNIDSVMSFEFDTTLAYEALSGEEISLLDSMRWAYYERIHKEHDFDWPEVYQELMKYWLHDVYDSLQSVGKSWESYEYHLAGLWWYLSDKRFDANLITDESRSDFEISVGGRWRMIFIAFGRLYYPLPRKSDYIIKYTSIVYPDSFLYLPDDSIPPQDFIRVFY